MTITATSLNDGGNTGQNSITTGSVTLASGRVSLLAVFNFLGAGPSTPVCTGWTSYRVQTVGSHKATLFHRLGDDSSGTHSITFGGTTQDIIDYIIDEFDGVDTGGTNGSNALVQAVGGNGSGGTPAWTLAAFGAATNTAYCVASNDAAQNTPDSGYSALGSILVGRYWDSVYKTPNGEDTSPNMVAASGNWIGIAAEIKAAAAGGGAAVRRRREFASLAFLTAPAVEAFGRIFACRPSGLLAPVGA